MHWDADRLLVLLALASLLAWLAMCVYIIANRLLYDARNRGLGWATQALHARELAALPLAGRMAAVHDIVKGLPLRSLERLVMDTSLPQWVRDACSVQVMRSRDPARLLATARAQPEDAGKWDHIAALFLLARNRHPDTHALLQRALAEDDVEVRHAAITLLGETGDARAAEILIGGLLEPGALRSRIASQLDRFRFPIANLLLQLTHSPLPEVRATGALLLWRHADRPDVEAVLEAMAGDGDPGVRKAAIQSLGETTHATGQASSIARRLLDDETSYVRAHAARTLARLDAGNAAARIAPLLADPDWWVRQAAKESLLAIGERALPHVVAQLDSPDRFARNGAADVLQGIGAIPMLVERAAGSGNDANTASTLLDKIMHAGERNLAGDDRRLHPSWSITGSIPEQEGTS